jgi:hypothetical protein
VRNPLSQVVRSWAEVNDGELNRAQVRQLLAALDNQELTMGAVLESLNNIFPEEQK